MQCYTANDFINILKFQIMNFWSIVCFIQAQSKYLIFHQLQRQSKILYTINMQIYFLKKLASFLMASLGIKFSKVRLFYLTLLIYANKASDSILTVFQNHWGYFKKKKNQYSDHNLRNSDLICLGRSMHLYFLKKLPWQTTGLGQHTRVMTQG